MSDISCGVHSLMILAGRPKAIVPFGIILPSVTSDPAPIMQLSPMIAPFIMVEPIPISVLLPIVQP